MHGGKQNGVGRVGKPRTGMFRRHMTDAQLERFEERYAEMLKDPVGAMLADAAFLQSKLDDAMERVGPDGMITFRRQGTKQTKQEWINTARNGEAPDWKPTGFKETNESVAESREFALEPIARVMNQANGIVANAAAMKSKGLIFTDDSEGELTRERMADILRGVFGEAGALEAHVPAVIDAEVTEVDEDAESADKDDT